MSTKQQSQTPKPTPHSVVVPSKGPVQETIKHAFIKKASTMLLLFLPLFMNAQSHIGERFEIPARYAIPMNERTPLYSFSDTVCVLQYGADTLEVCHIDLRTGDVYIQGPSFQIATYFSVDDWQDEFNNDTGIRALHAKARASNDCGDRETYTFDIYHRPISQTFYIKYVDKCQGVEVNIGDQKLARAIKWGYTVPVVPKGERPAKKLAKQPR